MEQRRVVAAGKLMRMPAEQVAEAAETSRSYAKKFGRFARERWHIEDLVQRNAPTIEGLYRAALRSAAQDVESEDAAARSAARRDAVQLITIAERYRPGAAGASASVTVQVGPGAGEHSLAELLQVALREPGGAREAIVDGGEA